MPVGGFVGIKRKDIETQDELEKRQEPDNKLEGLFKS